MNDQLFPIEDIERERFVNRFSEPLEKKTATEQAKDRELYPVSHLVSNNHPVTSVEAAVKVRPKIGKLEQIVLDLLAQHPEGLTIFQMCELSGKPYNSISPRPSRLIEKKLIYAAGVGKSPSGNKATIYRLVENG